MGSGCSRNASVSSSEQTTQSSATESLYPKTTITGNGSSQNLTQISAADLLGWIEKYENLLVTFYKENGTITWCNHSWKRDLGYRKSDVVGKDIFHFLEDKLDIANLVSNGEKWLHVKAQNGEKRGFYCLFDSREDQVFGSFCITKSVADVAQQVEEFKAQEKKLLEVADDMFQSVSIPPPQKQTAPDNQKPVTESTLLTAGQKRPLLGQQSFNSFKDFLPSKPIQLTNSGPLVTPKKKFYTPEERRRMLLSSTSTADLLRKSNLGAMMKFQMDKSKKSSSGPVEKMAKILLWTNDQDEKKTLHSILEEEGYDVLEAQKPDDIYRILNINTLQFNNDPPQVDILVVDVDKALIPEPQESGFAVYDNIRQKYFPNELPVVFLSKLTSNQEERLLDGNEYLSRPVHKAEFLSKVKNLVYIKKLNDVQTCFVPREFLDLLGCSTITDIKLGKVVQRVMTVIFVDIRSFTTLSESMTPQENFQFINTYLSVIGPVVRQHRGFIDKFMGDGTLAIFPKASSDAIFASLAMQKIAKDFNFHSRKIEIGVGVNTGQIMLGIIGEDCRMSCDVISSTVNMSSRLEELTKHYKCKVIASEHSFLPAKDIVFGRELDHVRVVGIKEPIRIYDVWGSDNDATPDLVSKKERYEAGRKLYCERQFDKALKIFGELKKEQDVPSEIMYNRCLDLIEHPPKEDWTEVFQFKHK